LKDDLPTARVARTRAKRRQSSKKYYNKTTKLADKKWHSTKQKKLPMATSAAKANIKTHASANDAQEIGVDATFDIACK
jgi:hypothetical protein